jgi:hypothetical protein
VRILHSVGWRAWYYVGSGSSGYTKSHHIVLISDGSMVRICDRHTITKKQIDKMVCNAPKGYCKRCTEIMTEICRANGGDFG